MKSLGPETKASLETHSYSGKALGLFPDFVQSLLAVKRACAEANADLGYIKKKQSTVLLRSIRDLAQDASVLNLMVADVWQGGGAIAINMNINEAIGIKAGDIDTYCGLANLHQSTADVVATSARLAIFGRLAKVLHQCQSSLDAISSFTENFGNERRQAYTCLQPALQVTVKNFLSGVQGSLIFASKHAQESNKVLLEVSLGGTVVGDGQGAPRDYQACVVKKLAAIVRQPVRLGQHKTATLQTSYDIVAVMNAISGLARIYLKLGRDLRLEQSPLGSIGMPRLIAGSSFFKGKINPTMAETLMGCCLQVIGYQAVVNAASEQAELDLNVFELFMTIPVLESLALMESCLDKFNRFGLSRLQLKSEG